MNVVGTTQVELTSFIFSDLHGVEARCAETHAMLEPGEKVVIFAEGVVSEDGRSVRVDPAIRFIRILPTTGQNGQPIEEFISRYINNLPTPEASFPTGSVPGDSVEHIPSV